MHYPIPRRRYGNTGIELPLLGLGAAQLGSPAVPLDQVRSLIDLAFDAGVTLFDTAPSYGESEARLGDLLAGRRDRAVVSTKLGYGVPGVADWTGPCIAAGIDLALARLRTDAIDIVHLHSCPADVALRDDILGALAAAKQTGKVRAVAYSGENDDFLRVARSGRFDGLMASLNLFDQRIIDAWLNDHADGAFIAKRPLANAPWRFAEQPHGDYSETYWQRMRAIGLQPEDGLTWGGLALGFVAAQPGVSSCIVGTANPAHLQQAIEWISRGPLDTIAEAEWRDVFTRRDTDWVGQL